MKKIAPLLSFALLLLNIQAIYAEDFYGEVYILDRTVDDTVLTGFEYAFVNSANREYTFTYDLTNSQWKARVKGDTYTVICKRWPSDYKKPNDVVIEIKKGKEIIKIYPKHQKTEETPLTPYNPPKEEPKIPKEAPKPPKPVEPPKTEIPTDPLTPYVPPEPKPTPEEVLIDKPTPQSLLENPPKPGEPYYEEYLQLLKELEIPKTAIPKTNVARTESFRYFVISIVLVGMATALLFLMYWNKQKPK